MQVNSAGKIYIVGTPIGNLGDMSPRALQALRAVDVICAEDTRVTGKLLHAFEIDAKVERLDEATMGARVTDVIARAQAGTTFAYCSDAGMPGVSDPGLRLVDAAYDADVAVEVVPGPTAAATAYVASGTLAQNFYFGGFFPRKTGERAQVLESLKSLDAALIFYESPNRIADALAFIEGAMPARKIAVCRELTKLHEEVVRGSISEVRAIFNDRAQTGRIKGEIAFVIDPATQAELSKNAESAQSDAAELAAALAAEGLKTKEIAKRVSKEFAIPRNAAYEIAMKAGA